MAVSQADIDNLNEALASGTRQVTIGGQTVTYQTVESLIAARNDLQRQLDRQNNVAKRRVRYASHAGKGFD
jgi:hypothetical protein